MSQSISTDTDLTEQIAACCPVCRANANNYLTMGNRDDAIGCIVYCKSGHSNATNADTVPPPPRDTGVEISIESDVRFTETGSIVVPLRCVRINACVNAPGMSVLVGTVQGRDMHGASPTIAGTLLGLENALLATVADVRRQRMIAERIDTKPEEA